MSNIQTFLEKILSARYGKDVRQSIHDAIVEIDNVADTAQGSATEAAAQAEQYRNETEQLRNEVAEIVPEGYADLVEQVQENTVKVDTIIEKADLGIKETAAGEELHLIDSAEGKAVEFALYGKAKQNTTSGKNLLPYPYYENTNEESGISWVVNDDNTVTAKGTATAITDFFFAGIDKRITLKAGSYILSGCPSGGKLDSTYFMLIGTVVDGATTRITSDVGNGATFTLEKDTEVYLLARVITGYTANNLIFKPMIRDASITDDTYEPYTNGASPNPQYPQPIEVSGESGSVAVKSENEDGTQSTTAIISTENGLAGIKVSSGGNYTDQNGQQWICDEIVKYADGSGEYIQRIGNVLLKDLSWYKYGDFQHTFSTILKVLNKNIMCNKYSVIDEYLYNDKKTGIYKNLTNNQLIVSDLSCSSVNEFKAHLTDEIVYYTLAEPIIRPLTAEEIAEIEKLHTFYPITNISNDFDCGMSVTYNADSKNYIDKQLAEMERAREQAMMSMFLLLPEETQATMIENDVNNLLTESEN